MLGLATASANDTSPRARAMSSSSATATRARMRVDAPRRAPRIDTRRVRARGASARAEVFDCVRVTGQLCAVRDVKRDDDALVVAALAREDAEDGVWFEDDAAEAFTVMRDACVVVPSEYSQRMQRDRIRNPHGEHAEDCWIIADS